MFLIVSVLPTQLSLNTVVEMCAAEYECGGE